VVAPDALAAAMRDEIERALGQYTAVTDVRRSSSSE
jgi:hypothetical protein